MPDLWLLKCFQQNALQLSCVYPGNYFRKQFVPHKREMCSSLICQKFRRFKCLYVFNLISTISRLKNIGSEFVDFFIKFIGKCYVKNSLFFGLCTNYDWSLKTDEWKRKICYKKHPRNYMNLMLSMSDIRSFCCFYFS